MNARAYNSPPEIRTAHDVRKLAGCVHCSGLGDKTAMLKSGKAFLIHGRCFIERNGMAEFLAVPQEQTDQLGLNDIGSDATRALLDKRSND